MSNDSLISNYTTIGISNQWLNAQQQPIAGATAKAYKPVASGVYYLKTTIGVCSSISSPVQYQPGGCTVATEEPSVQQVSVTPNPAADRIYVQLPEFLPDGFARCRIFNLQGVLMAEAEYPTGHDPRFEFDVHNWPTGNYTVQVAAGSGAWSGGVQVVH